MGVRVALHAPRYRQRCRLHGISDEDAARAVIEERNGVVFLAADSPIMGQLFGAIAGTPEPQPPPPPALAREADPVSWLQKAKNFAVATVQHVAAGMPTASDEEILRRHAICQTCEHFVNDSCGKCGCPILRDRQFVSKLAWADQSCPVGKWGPAAAS